MAVAHVIAWMRPERLTTLPFLPPTLPSVATSLPFVAAFAAHNTKRQVAASRESA
jgi:hypothetical protein